MASAIPWVLSPVLKATGVLDAIGGIFKGPKPARTPPPITRNDAAASVRMSDSMRKRRGAGANELTGGGAEASSGGGKTLLGQ